ncbi:MAG: uroporphyrinogen-III synthase [Armatimonadetes bacterium]|nr:uroporphyrinogen-III synthase [Armatimonadota bacterium]
MIPAGPLQGVTVLVTRPKEGAGALAQALGDLGAEVWLAPAIAVAPPEEPGPLDALLAGLAGYDWLLFTSANGVRSVARRAAETGAALPACAPPKLAAVGSATADALSEAWRAPDLLPGTATGAGLAAALGDVRGLRIALARADIAAADLPEALRAGGADVTDVTAYRIRTATAEAADLAARASGPAPDYIALASPSAARGLDAMLHGATLDAWWDRSRLACIGPVTAEAVRAMGLEPRCVSPDQTAAGLAAAILEDHRKHA